MWRVCALMSSHPIPAHAGRGVAAVVLVAAVAYKANNRASSIWSNDRSTVGTTVKPEAEPSKPATTDAAAVTTIEIGPVVGSI